MLYLRARWLSLGAASLFMSEDLLSAQSSTAASTSRYHYTEQQPADFVDPSGFRFTRSFGYAVEDNLCEQYTSQFVAHSALITCGRQARTGQLPALKPDILDHKRRIFMEVKPLSISGIYSGSHQLALYTLSLGLAGYSPDVTWAPPDPILTIGNEVVGVFNFFGLLFYTDAVRTLEELALFAAAKSLAELRRLVRLPRFAYRTVLWEPLRVRRIVSIGTSASRARANLQTRTPLLLAAHGVL